jgi:hypothetical protein
MSMEYIGGPLDGGNAMPCCEAKSIGGICTHGVKTPQVETVAMYFRHLGSDGIDRMMFVRSMTVQQYMDKLRASRRGES